MSILNKFIKNNFQKPYILVCSSKTHMMYAKDILDKNIVSNELIPTPKGFGEICTTAIKFDFKDKKEIENLIKKSKIEYKGIYSLDNRYRYDLSSVLEMNISDDMKKIINKVQNNEDISKKDVLYLLNRETEEEYNALITTADIIRKECVGDRIELRAAVEFSNYCIKNCNYCGLRKDSKQHRYRMSEEEILEEVDYLYKIGIKTVILQSGEDPFYTTDKLLNIIKSIKEKYRMGITLSVGERTEKEYRLFSEAGVNNYLLKIETYSKRLFDYIHPDDDLDTRVQHTTWIKEAGMRVGSGGMIGLPTQTLEEIADVILFQRDFGVHMIGFGPFLPAKGTPYENYSKSDLKLNLKVVAITRIICQNVFIPATTAIASLNSLGQTLALEAGANTIMLISTPKALRENYGIYSNKNMVDLDFAIQSTLDSKRKLPKYLNYSYIEELGYKIDNSIK
ncbi:[Clostridium sp. D2Q-11]|uniref:[FeFe] hydrogenase H-cluster radical SAM maturase HydE n=1 Tax=Anaeromonas frigoriresistens TaxID=2683708 RepID=A0A942UYT4_9FIRM|nr:[FeFe] hydrogenase H-cluster radical SAM maturase HydE [Anaeromonas frigoriresistens]MBS4539299.1 [FeFe] hydrogenase H-cluster radical SAM maturase HydE [Anaeromonas frigoriresistens]